MMNSANTSGETTDRQLHLQSAGPLEGLRVVEIGAFVAASHAGRLFAEFGADVIKIEPPGGDPLRGWRVIHEGTSLWWSVQSRNKRSICLDLKNATDAGIALGLIARADILIENLKPGVMERLGFGWDELRSINPKLVFVRISGFGQTGPMRDKPGFGAIGEAMGGIRYTTGDPTSPPARVGISLGDTVAGLNGVIGALMALHHVRSGGDGQVIDVSLVESVFALMEGLIPEFDLKGVIRERTGGRLPGISPSNTYRSKDGIWIVIAANSDQIFHRMMTAIGRDDLANDPGLAVNELRVARDDFLDRVISEWVGGNAGDDVLSVLDTAGVPSSKIYSAEDIVRDAHYQYREMVPSWPLDDGTQVKVPGIVPKLSETPGRIRWLGPQLGAHTVNIMSELDAEADAPKDAPLEAAK